MRLPRRLGTFASQTSKLIFVGAKCAKKTARSSSRNNPSRFSPCCLEHAGQVVTREEIQQRLWPAGMFVEFEHSISTAVMKLREALGDSAEHPRFIETLPRHGYRFIARVEPLTPGLSPQGKGGAENVSVSQPSPVGRGWSRGAGPGEGARLQKRWIVAATVGLPVTLLAILIGLNVAGLRDRLLRRAAAPPSIGSIAVLPLENLSRDPEQEYFADGMTEELITTLGRISALRVISRTSVMRYKGTKKTLPEIARELNVDGIVEGAVLRSGNRVRVTANLLNATTDRHVWAQTYESSARDVLVLQGELARAIAGEVEAKVTPVEQGRLTRARPINPEALELYLKGNDLLWRGDSKNALEYFQQATRTDPTYGRGHLGAAEAYRDLWGRIRFPAMEACANVKAYARKALELDDSLAEAHAMLAQALYRGDWDWAGAEQEIKRALEINPNCELAHGTYSEYLATQGRTEEAVAEARRQLEINPLLWWPYQNLGTGYYYGRRYDEALPPYEKAVQLSGDPHVWVWVAWTYREKGMYKEAIAGFLKMPDGAIKFGHLGNAYARAGQKAEARKLLQKLIELSKQQLGTWEVALVYAGLGEKDRAFEWLERAYKIHDSGMCWLKVDQPLDPLRSDPRFQDLLRRMNLPP